MRISLFLMVFIITTFLFSASASDYIIDDDLIYIDDSNVYLSAYPHTLRESEYVYFNLTSKQYSGDIDFYFGFDSLQCKPISAEILIGGNWIDISHRFNSINYNYDGLNKWYYLKEIPIYSNIDYTLRAYLQINEISTGGKYGVAVKPSSETLLQSINNNHFYYLDPWWNGSYLYRKTITLTGNTSGAQTNYQILLNVTYESGMQTDFNDLRFTNDTHQINAWLESKVDSSHALVWVEFPTTPPDTIEQTYYMYYNKSDAASNWNIETTFLFGDGFEDGNSNGWTINNVFATVETSRPKKGLYSLECIGAGYTCKSSLAGGSNYAWHFSVNPDIVVADSNHYWIIYLQNGASYAIDLRIGRNAKFQYYSGGYIDICDIAADTWYDIEVYNITTTTFDIKINGTPYTGLSVRADPSAMNEFYCQAASNQEEKLWIDNFYIRKYVVNPATYIFGSEEKLLYVPPNPITLQNTTDDFWINHTWQPGAGNVTDSYNVSVNNVWHNATINTYWNTTYGYSNNSWQNITVWAYNNTNMGNLSTDSISQNTQLYFTNLPTNLQKTYDHIWINWTWNESFLGTHSIDSYNVSINGTWNNNITNHFYNHTNLTYELISSIVVYGYNNTQGLSIYYISDSYTFPIKNKMVKAIEQLVTPIQIIADKFFNIIPFIISIILFAGFGLTIMVMTSRLKKW